MYIDSHCHLEAKDFRAADGSDERPEILRRAREAGVRKLICIGSGSSFAEIENALAYAERDPDIYAAVGIHPHDARNVEEPGPDAPQPCGEELWRRICAAAAHPRVVAVGETGLDYYYNHSSKAAQRALFERSLGLAVAVNKPVTLHIRDAQEEARELVRACGGVPRGGVVHCFTGNLEDARRWLELGFHISFSGIVTFKSAKDIQAAARFVPADRLLIETDCPYLSPNPLRGKRNEPSYVVHTAAFLAELRGQPVAELAAAATAATERLFNL